MGVPTIFSGKRTKALTAKGLLLRDGSIVDNDGSKNYITNGHAEIGTTGWATYADAAGATPVDGTGGAPNVTFARSTTTPLAGDASFLLTKDAANRQGEGVSYAFTLERADNVMAQSMILQFSYETGGTFTTGTSSDIKVFIYNVTDATVITPSQNYIGSSSGKVITTFNTVSTSSSYRLIFHVATTSASAWTFKLDRVIVKPIDTIVSSSGSDSTVILTDGNGFGSTNTNVRRYVNSTVTGTAMSYTDSATDGGYVTINQEGTYAMNRLDRNTGAAANFGITLNEVAAGGINAVADANRLSYVMTASNLSSNAPNPGAYLYEGDIIRACDDSGAKTNDTSSLTSTFIITKVKEPSLPQTFITATGGTITTDGNFKVHTFTSSGTFTITGGSGSVDSLVVGGGGGAGGSVGGGGGAGRVIYTAPGATYGTGSYTVTVGAGGAGGAPASNGSNGSSSAFDSITAAGGGGGGAYNANGNATNGSGGGAGGSSDGVVDTGGAAGLALSNAGGDNNGSSSGNNPSAGGGGAGAAGGTVVVDTTGGNGGVGVSNSITGAAVFYGGGGGGVAPVGVGGTAGTGGNGGGGAGNNSGVGTAGTANTGGGGGASGVASTGGAGGSGVVILRYQYQ